MRGEAESRSPPSRNCLIGLFAHGRGALENTSTQSKSLQLPGHACRPGVNWAGWGINTTTNGLGVVSRDAISTRESLRSSRLHSAIANRHKHHKRADLHIIRHSSYATSIRHRSRRLFIAVRLHKDGARLPGSCVGRTGTADTV